MGVLRLCISLDTEIKSGFLTSTYIRKEYRSSNLFLSFMHYAQDAAYVLGLRTLVMEVNKGTFAGFSKRWSFFNFG